MITVSAFILKQRELFDKYLSLLQKGEIQVRLTEKESIKLGLSEELDQDLINYDNNNHKVLE